jgi:hypothetical protein
MKRLLTQESGFVEALILIVLTVVLLGVVVYTAVKLHKPAAPPAKTPHARLSQGLQLPAALACKGKKPAASLAATEREPMRPLKTATPTDNVAGILDVNVDCGVAKVVYKSQPVTYTFCPTLDVYDAQGKVTSASLLKAGDYVDVTLGGDATCIAALQYVPAPVENGSCDMAGYGGGGDVFFVSQNEQAHALIYQPLGSKDLYITRWCTPPVVTDKSGNAMPLSGLKQGNRMGWALSSDSWVTTLKVE